MRGRWQAGLGLALFLCYGVPHDLMAASWRLAGTNVAVLVFPQTPESERYVKTAQTRLEGVLRDNGIAVLDQAKADELRSVWRQLENPDYFVTDEDFARHSAKFKVTAIARTYLRATAFQGLADFYSATAHVDVRMVGSDAQVNSNTSGSMGIPGKPASDGLTESSAMVNAVQRAVDDVCIAGGLDVLAPAAPYHIGVKLEGPVRLPNPVELAESSIDKSLGRYAELKNPNKWTTERVTSTAQVPGSSLAAVAGYLQEGFRGGQTPQVVVEGTKPAATAIDRLGEQRGGGPSVFTVGGGGGGIRYFYGSRVHLVDTGTGKEINVFDCESLDYGGKVERDVKVCAFADNWRYLAAATALHLYLWDTQQGRRLHVVETSGKGVPGAIRFARTGNESYLVVGPARGTVDIGYRIVADRR